MKPSKETKVFFSRQNLFQLLIAKSVIEALLVTALAVSFYLVVTNPHLRGWLDQADARTISGWVVNDKSAGTRVEVQLFIDDRFVESRVADSFRPDVQQAQRANDEWHGFVFQLPGLERATTKPGSLPFIEGHQTNDARCR
jgi:hypothetical protein